MNNQPYFDAVRDALSALTKTEAIFDDITRVYSLDTSRPVVSDLVAVSKRAIHDRLEDADWSIKGDDPVDLADAADFTASGLRLAATLLEAIMDLSAGSAHDLASIARTRVLDAMARLSAGESLDTKSVGGDRNDGPIECGAKPLAIPGAAARATPKLKLDVSGTGDDHLQGKSRSTAFRLIGAMAINAYELDIHAPRIEGIGALQTGLSLVGVSIGDDTIRTYLKKAAALIVRPASQ
jgi:hypothetical protein